MRGSQKTVGMNVWIGFIWFRIGANGRLLLTQE